MKLTDYQRPEGSEGFDLTFGEDNDTTRERLRELIIYISEKSRRDIRFGATKLNKLLVYSDFIAFREFGKPITGAQYMRWDHGLMPVHLVPVRNEMAERGDIAIEPEEYYTYRQVRVKPKRPPKRELFSRVELDLVDAIIDEFKEYDASTASHFNHGRVWGMTKNGDRIPYEAAFISDAGLTEDDLNWAHGLIEQYDQVWRSHGQTSDTHPL